MEKLTTSKTTAFTTKEVPSSNCLTRNELSKQGLLQLCKTNLEAQRANAKWNQFNSILSSLVNRSSQEQQVNDFYDSKELFICRNI